MHTLIRRFIKTGGIFLLVGLALGAWLLLSRELLQVAGASFVLWMLWPRIRAVGSQLREAQGERF